MKLKHLLLATLTAVATLTPTVRASETLHTEHSTLWDSLREVGVSIYVNDPEVCRGGDIDGRYISRQRRVDICQDDYKPYNQTLWTANDLDTLRHEAHHVLQDCTGGNPYDSVLNKFFPDEDYKSFVANALTPSQINQVTSSYRSGGADDHIIALELEAFSVSQSVSADLIGQKLVEFCGVSKM